MGSSILTVLNEALINSYSPLLREYRRLAWHAGGLPVLILASTAQIAYLQIMMKGKQNIIWHRMRTRRIAMGWSAEDFAKQMGEQGVRISAKQVIATEKGERRVLDRELLVLARVLCVSIHSLIMGTNR